MSAVIYDSTTGREIKSFDTLQGARTALTRMNKAISMTNPINLVACSREEFNAQDIEVEVTNIYGKKCKIRRSQQGGCCDPSTELYWSM